MMVFRVVFALLMAAAVVCFAMYAGTGQARWRQRGWRLVKWTLGAALGCFAVRSLEGRGRAR